LSNDDNNNESLIFDFKYQIENLIENEGALLDLTEYEEYRIGYLWPDQIPVEFESNSDDIGDFLDEEWQKFIEILETS